MANVELTERSEVLLLFLPAQMISGQGGIFGGTAYLAFPFDYTTVSIQRDLISRVNAIQWNHEILQYSDVYSLAVVSKLLHFIFKILLALSFVDTLAISRYISISPVRVYLC